MADGSLWTLVDLVLGLHWQLLSLRYLCVENWEGPGVEVPGRQGGPRCSELRALYSPNEKGRNRQNKA